MGHQESKSAPQIVFGGRPFDRVRSALSSKSQFASILHKYEVLQDMAKHKFVHPLTFRISQSPSECREFFDLVFRQHAPGRLPSEKHPDWLIKPVQGTGG